MRVNSRRTCTYAKPSVSLIEEADQVRLLQSRAPQDSLLQGQHRMSLYCKLCSCTFICTLFVVLRWLIQGGGAKGTVATTVCSPADVLKSRIMNASGPGSSVRLLFSSPPPTHTHFLNQSTLNVIRQSMAAEGPMFMFKGWVPAWTRLQPTTILIFLTLEQLKNGVDWSRSRGFTAL